jgi:hypothetical protein
LLQLWTCEAPVAGDLLASSVQCVARSLVKTLQLGTSVKCGQNVVESVTPENSAPETALTVLPLNLHLNLQLYLSDLTLLLPQLWLWWPWHLVPCPYLGLCICPWLAALE